MQPLEIALLFSLVAALGVLAIPPALRTGTAAILEVVLPVVAAVFFQVHLLVDGPNRALVPAYAVGFGLLVLTAIRILARRPANHTFDSDDDRNGVGSDVRTPPRGSPAVDLTIAVVGLGTIVYCIIAS